MKAAQGKKGFETKRVWNCHFWNLFCSPYKIDLLDILDLSVGLNKFFWQKLNDWTPNYNKPQPPKCIQTSKIFAWNKGQNLTLDKPLSIKRNVNFSNSRFDSNQHYCGYLLSLRISVAWDRFIDLSHKSALHLLNISAAAAGSLSSRFRIILWNCKEYFMILSLWY